jgi:hypothetical protein
MYEFYSAAQLYTNPVNAAATNALAEDLVIFAQDPANIPAAIPGVQPSKKNYWASVNEMNFMRANDKGYPAFTGPQFVCGADGASSCAQLP